MTRLVPAEPDSRVQRVKGRYGAGLVRSDSGFEEYSFLNTTREFSTEPSGNDISHLTSHEHGISSSTTRNIMPEPKSPESQPEKATTASLSQSQKSMMVTPRRESVDTSSGESGSKSRRSRPGSKQSPIPARRTSTAHRSSRSTSTQKLKDAATMPVPTRDIDDVLALHYRSCSLFPNIHVRSAPTTPPADFSEPQWHNRPPHTESPPNLTAAQSADTLHGTETSSIEDDVDVPHYIPATTIHWNSLSTRKRQYAEIDRSRKGMRGFFRKITPKWMCQPTPKFYDPAKDSDAGSVRRYRVELPEDDEKSATPSSGRPIRPPMNRAWSCF